MLAFYTFFSILNLRSQISNRPFMSTINVFLCVLGVTRAACFLIDPYTSGQVMPGFLGWVLWDVGYPCLLSAFSLIQLAFAQLTQVKFRPETLRRKSALSLAITTHFALVLGSDLVTAFESHLEVVRWVVQTVFLSWGLVLCLTFLYGGARILKLLRTIPHSAFQNSQQNTTNNKGILQLALLAQCNNIASSVITAAAPSLLTPKIRITDEHDHTYSYLSSQDSAPASRRPSSRASITSECAASPSGVRMAESEQSDIAEESEEHEGKVSPAVGRRERREVEERREGGHSSGRGERKSSRKGSEKRKGGSEGVRGGSVKGKDRREAKYEDVKEVTHRGKTEISEKIGDIIIKVEEVGSVTEEDNGKNGIIVDAYDQEDIKFIDNGNEVEVEKPVSNGVQKDGNENQKESDSPRKLAKVPSVKSLDSVLRSDSHSDGMNKPNASGIRKSSFSGAMSCPDSDIKPAIKAEDSEKANLLGTEGENVPKRKKSLTWYEDMQQPSQTESPQADKDRDSRTPEREEVERNVVSKDHHRRTSSTGKRSSRGSEKQKLRHTKSYELGEMSRRKSSSASVASRKGSEHYPGLASIPPYQKDLKLAPSSPTSVRRSSRKSLKDETEAFLSRHSSERGDVTLSSILNHIAYVNQTASAHKLPTSFKDSRKAQVQQVLLVTYITAALGTLLSLALVYGVYGNFTSIAFLRQPSWLWFTYESGCRFLEFLMGCAMANITRQPVNRHAQYPYSMRIKQRNSIYM